MKPNSPRSAFISVGAVCQRLFWLFCVWVEGVVLFVLRLNCLVKRKEALRGRNLSRDSRASSAPMVHPASDVTVASEAVFLPPIGHPNHASKNPSDSVRLSTPCACLTSSGYRHNVAVALDSRGGIVFPILRRRSGATRRVNSSLRSHRTQAVAMPLRVFRAE